MASNKGTPPMLSVYKEDYAAWVEDTARAIEDGRFHDIDRAALADEVRDLGKSERREIEECDRSAPDANAEGPLSTGEADPELGADDAGPAESHRRVSERESESAPRIA